MHSEDTHYIFNDDYNNNNDEDDDDVLDDDGNTEDDKNDDDDKNIVSSMISQTRKQPRVIYHFCMQTKYKFKVGTSDIIKKPTSWLAGLRPHGIVDMCHE